MINKRGVTLVFTAYILTLHKKCITTEIFPAIVGILAA